MGDRTCSVEGCGRADRIKLGMCNMHYQRFAKHGTTELAERPRCKMPKSCNAADVSAGVRACAVDGCLREYYGRGWCSLHYQRMRKTGTTDARVFVPRVCKVDGCDGNASAPGTGRGWCHSHYDRWKRWGDPLGAHRPVIGIAPCAIDGCDDLIKARNWCTKHYTRWQRYGDPVARMPGEVVNGCRICPRCRVDTPLSDWGVRAYCKSCDRANTAAYRVQNPYVPRGAPADCPHCGQTFLRNKRRSRYCSPQCSAERKNKDNWKHMTARRARLREAFVESFDRQEIFERDNWTCQICLVPIDRNAIFPDPSSASLDHIIPIARGGKHSRANAQTACLGCNVRKGARLAS